MFQSEVDGRVVPWDLMVKDVRPEHHHDLDYLVELLDWDANVNPNFAADHRVSPLPVRPLAESEPDGYREQWVAYGTPWYSATELTVLPKRAVTIRDAAAYGLIVTQGYGTFGPHRIGTPSMIRYGQMTEDELFVSAAAAAAGVRIENLSASDPLVILKHFGPGNPEEPAALASRAPAWLTPFPNSTTPCGPGWSAKAVRGRARDRSRHDARPHRGGRGRRREVRRRRSLPGRPAHDIDAADDDLKPLADKLRGARLRHRLGRRAGLAADRRRLRDGRRRGARRRS